MPGLSSRARGGGRVALACAVLALALGACGEDDNEESQSSTAAPASNDGGNVSVGMKDIKFVPENISARVGQKIVWTNNEAIPHNVTATDGADFASKTMQRDDTYEYTPTKAGTIKYVCTIHTGQNGQITVTG